MKIRTKFILQIGVTTNIIEWYGFCVYSYLVMEIAKEFFNKSDDIEAIVLAFSTFALSYVARPFGSLYFGYLGDRCGRCASLKKATLLMIIPTGLIGLLPTYEQISFLAPILLMILRLIQGFAAGGELPGTACYVYEAASENENRSFLCASVAISSMLGVLLGSLVVTLLTLVLNEQQMLAWGWRIPFLLGIPLLLIVLNIRNKMIEPKQVAHSFDAKDYNQEFTFKSFLFSTIQAVGLVAFLQICFYLLFIWMPTYIEYYLKLSSRFAHLSNTITILMCVIFSVTVSYFAKYIGRKKLIAFGIISITATIYPFFLLMSYRTLNWSIILIIQIGFALFLSSILGVIMEVLGNFYPKKFRNMGMNTSFTFASSILGGTAPAICSYFIKLTGLLTFPAIYIMIFGLLSLFVIRYVN